MPDGFIGGYLETNKALTDNANAQLIGQMNAFKLQTEIQDRSILNQARAGMMRDAPAWANGMMGAGGNGAPTMGSFDPSTPSPAQMANAEGSDTPITSKDLTVPGQPSPPSGPLKDPLTDTEAAKTASMLSMSYRSAIADGYRLRMAGDVKGAMEASTRADTVQKDLVQAQNEMRKERKEARSAIATALSNVTDGTTLNNMMNTLEDQFPGLKPYLGQKLARDRNGNFLWEGTGNPDAIKAMGDSIRTIAEQDKKADLSQQRAMQEERLEETRRENAERDEARRVNQEIAREGQDIRREVLAMNQEQREFSRQRNLTNDTNAQLNKNEVYKNYPKFQNAQAYADQIVAKLNTPGGYLSVTPPEMAALKKMYADTAYSFRPRTGGKYDSVEAQSFNGAWQKLDKTINSIGTGQMVWNESAARDVANTVSQLSYNANKAALITSLTAVDGAQKRGLKDISGITLRGDAAALVKAGDLKTVTENGKDYIIIKGGKGQADYKFLDPDSQ